MEVKAPVRTDPQHPQHALPVGAQHGITERRPFARGPAATSPRPWHRAALALLVVFAVVGSAFAQTPPEPDTLFAQLEQAAAGVPAAGFDVAAALAALGTPGEVALETIFAFVRDDIGFVPYRGALKGPAGVLVDRTGNALDRALLLKALLAANGTQAIVAHAVLDAQTAATAVAAERQGKPAAAPTEPVADGAARLAGLYGLDAQEVGARLDELAASKAALDRSIEERTAYQSAALSAALAAAGASAPTARRDAAANAVDHWWLQVQRDGAWVDLDPTLPTSAVGDVLAPAELRFDLTDLRLLAAVDGSCRDLSCGDRLHRVRVAVIVETWDGESLEETEVASTDLLAAEGLGRTVAFAAIPSDFPEDLDLYTTERPTDAYRQALLAVRTWQPALFVDDKTVGTTTVGADGTLSEGGRSGGGAAGNAGMLGGGIGGMFGGFGGAAAGDGDEGAGAFTAMWLEYTVTAAGAFQSVERREVFDLIGPAARAAGVTAVELTEAQELARAVALSGQTEIVVTGAGLPAAAIELASAARLLDKRAEWTEFYFQGGTLGPRVVADRLADLAALVTPLERFQQFRTDHLTGSPTGPLVVAYHQSLEPDLSRSAAFDIVSGAVAAGPGGDDPALVQGVRDTVTEAVLQERYADLAVPAAGQAAVAVAYSADLAAGRAWTVVSTVAELDAAAPDLSPDLRARIVGDLSAGRLAVVPPGGAGAVGWWRLDPSTGAVLGIGDRGWGQAFSEYTEGVNIVLQLRTVLNQYASIGRCLGIMLSMPLQGQTQGVNDEFAECVFTTVCSGVNTALAFGPETNWTNIIILATIDALWGGVPETGYGGFCGGLFKKLQGA